MDTINDDIRMLYRDLAEVMRTAYPQGTALIEHERGAAVLLVGAHELTNDARLAVDVLGPRNAPKLARAMSAVGQRYEMVAKRITELAAEAEAAAASKPEQPHSGQSIQHTDVDSITSRARAKAGEADGRT